MVCHRWSNQRILDREHLVSRLQMHMYIRMHTERVRERFAFDLMTDLQTECCCLARHELDDDALVLCDELQSNRSLQRVNECMHQ